MKRSDLVLVCLALLAVWLPGSSQAQNAVVGTGYPTSMVPQCCLKPPSPFPGKGVRILNKHRKPILTLEPPSTDGPFEMYFSIPIATLQNKCGGLLPGNFEIGYDFLNNGTQAYGPDIKGTLQSFQVSILNLAAPVFDLQVLPVRTAKKVQPKVYSYTLFPVASPKKGLTYPLVQTGQGRYPLPEKAAPHFVAGNTLTLHATGINNIYLGVWCRKPE